MVQCAQAFRQAQADAADIGGCSMNNFLSYAWSEGG
uniref:Putative efflux transporter n=1 Tax=mine drainage metagenome TaxID=410659 RepID=E6QRA7_9ZZZZ